MQNYANFTIRNLNLFIPIPCIMSRLDDQDAQLQKCKWMAVYFDGRKHCHYLPSDQQSS